MGCKHIEELWCYIFKIKKKNLSFYHETFGAIPYT